MEYIGNRKTQLCDYSRKSYFILIIRQRGKVPFTPKQILNLLFIRLEKFGSGSA